MRRRDMLAGAGLLAVGTSTGRLSAATGPLADVAATGTGAGPAMQDVTIAVDPAALLASERKLAVGSRVRTADGHLYAVLPGNAATYDLETAGGAKLAVVPVGRSISVSAMAGDPTGVSGSADALIKAWKAVPEGGKLVIDGTYLIEKECSLPYKAIDIDGRGELVITPGRFCGVSISHPPDYEVPGTALVSLAGGASHLSWRNAPNIAPNEYYVVIESREELIVRAGSVDFTPYSRNEIHSIGADDWTLFDPILYTYADLSKVTLRLYRKGRLLDWSALRIRAAATAAPMKRTLMLLSGLSNINLRGLRVDASRANGLGNGLAVRECCHLNFDDLRIFGFNANGGDSYRLVNSLSAHLTFNRYVSESEAPPSGRKISRCYVARHGNQIDFNDCVIVGADDHYGSNYRIRGGTMARRGFGFAGRNFSARDVSGVGLAGGLFFLRSDTPFAEGLLELENIQLTPDSQLLSNRIPEKQDPLSRVTDYKFFDEVRAKNITFLEGAQEPDAQIELRGVPNRSGLKMHKTALIEFDGIRHRCKRQRLGQCTIYVGDIDYDRLIVRDHGPVPTTTDYYGDFRYTGTQPATSILEIVDCPAFSLYYFGGVAGQMLIVRDSVVDGNGNQSGILVSGAADMNIVFKNVRLNKPVVAAGKVIGTFSLDMTDTLFSALPAVSFSHAVNIRRGVGSAMAASLVVPDAFRNKMLNYLAPGVWKEA